MVAAQFQYGPKTTINKSITRKGASRNLRSRIIEIIAKIRKK